MTESVNNARQYRLWAFTALADGRSALYPVRRDQNASLLMVSATVRASLLAR